MPFLHNSDPIWVATPIDLLAMTAELERCSQIAVDTESNSLYVYKEQVCLIQFSTGTADYLVDTLAFDELSQLAPIFESPNIEKIFHAAEYDIICLKRDFGFVFNNIFDTMLASRIVGYKEFGLAAILGKEFGIEVDKRFQRANWGKRPLPKEQLSYARLDTHYLIELKKRLKNQLHNKKLTGLAQEDFNRLPDVQITTHENGLAHFWRVAAKAEFTPRQLAILYELYEYRDQRARTMNRPPFKVLNDKTLVDIAQQSPQNKGELSQIQGLTHKVLKNHADSLLIAVKHGLQKQPPKRPARTFPNGRFLFLYDSLRKWRKVTARRNGVESDIVLPRDILEEIAHQEPHNHDQLNKIMKELPWRFERYGSSILDVINHPEEL